ncbi:nucleotidyltransferase domain-containing protein [Clostridium rectalis]|uniref:nucleotidyltransferase domain-containing protein n=1 Tax=Clostridium rectalis TaxID=2040295 RepID=UPI000F637751|nr:nucleotidyltransferase domain-containing protein [Clostridium rectalis]
MEGDKKIEVFKNKIIHLFNGRLQCILLTGSYSRRENTEDSDIDIWIFLDKVLEKDLFSIGDILLNLDPIPKLNPQCTSFNESMSTYFSREYSPIQYNTDGIILYGELKIPSPNKIEFSLESKRLAVYVIMGIRHFVCTNEKEELLLKRKIRKRILKPLMWAIRYKYTAYSGVYYKNLQDLKEVCTEGEKNIIEVYEKFLHRDIKEYLGKSKKIMMLCYRMCMNIIDQNGD